MDNFSNNSHNTENSNNDNSNTENSNNDNSKTENSNNDSSNKVSQEQSIGNNNHFGNITGGIIFGSQKT